MVVPSASHSRRVVVVLRMVVLVLVDDVDDVLVDVVLVAPEVVDVGDVVDVVEVVDDVGVDVEDDVELDVDVPEARGRCPAGQIVVEVVDDVLLEEDEVWAPAGAAVTKSTSASRKPTVQRTARPGRQGYIIGVA